MKMAVAAGAGACAAALCCAAVLAFLSGVSLQYGHTAQYLLTIQDVLSYLLSLVLAPALVVAGGALVGRALGMGWVRASVASLAALVAGIFLTAQISLRLLYNTAPESSFVDAARAAVFMALMVVLAAVLSGGVPTGSGRVLVVVAGMAALIVAAAALVAVIWLASESDAAVIGSGIAAWVLLPAVAALASPPTYRRTT